VQKPRAQSFDARALGAVRVENLAHAPAQRHARAAPEREQRIEGCAGSGLGGGGGLRVE